MNSPLISIIICTYNRAALLADVLQSVVEQSLDKSLYEVIVVDNNSTDDTTLVGNRFAARYANLRLCSEPRQGLSHARNRGWQEAKGSYVAYLDDDCKAPAHWLAVAQEVIYQIAPAVFGGPYFAYYQTPKPAWYQDRYGSWQPANCAGPIEPEALHGGNLLLQRALLQEVDGFDPTLGMNGSQLAYGEETALLLQLHASHPTALFYYEPRLVIHHLVRAEKMRLRWRFHQRFVHGQAVYRVMKQHGRRKAGRVELAVRMLAHLLALFWHMTIKTLRRDRAKHPYYQSYWYESALEHLYQLGLRYEQFQSIRKA